MFGLLASGVRGFESLFGGFAGLAFVRELVVRRCEGEFRGARLGKRLLKPVVMRMGVGPKLRQRLTVAAQGFHRLIPCQFGVSDLGLEIMRERLHFSQRPLRPFAGGGFSGQCGFGALQTAAAGRGCLWRAAIRRQFLALITPQHGDRDIAVLDKAASVQPSAEAVGKPVRLVVALLVSPVALPFAQQAKSLSHLRFGLINRRGVPACRGVGRSGNSVLLVFAGGILESQFQIFRQFRHLVIGSGKTMSGRVVVRNNVTLETQAMSGRRHSVDSSLGCMPKGHFFKQVSLGREQILAWHTLIPR
jgi:hypothetical protein